MRKFKVDNLIVRKNGILYGSKVIQSLKYTGELILGVGSEVYCNDGDNEVIGISKYVEPKRPYYCDRCGEKFDSLTECIEHANKCDFRGYLDD